jgi:hypothetical protein
MALIQGFEGSGKPLLLKHQGLKGDNANSLHRLIFPAIATQGISGASRGVQNGPAQFQS